MHKVQSWQFIREIKTKKQKFHVAEMLHTSAAAVAPPQEERNSLTSDPNLQPLLFAKQAARNYNMQFCYGVLLVLFAFGLFASFAFALLSKLFVQLVEQQGNEEMVGIDVFYMAIAKDWYYMLLVPMTVPVIIWWAYLNWLGMKIFRHN